MARIIDSADVGRLAGLFKGVPAIIVSAGPSLDKNIEQLHRAVGKAIIIAVDAALPPLLDNGITPNLVCTVDPIDNKIPVFETIDDYGDMHLITIQGTSTNLIDAFKGPRFMAGVSTPAGLWAAQYIGDRPDDAPNIGGIFGYYPHGPKSLLNIDLSDKSGGPASWGGLYTGFPETLTVAHTAFYAARGMGCDPIILIGQDLALGGIPDFLIDAYESIPRGGYAPDDERYLTACRESADHTGLQAHASGTLPSWAVGKDVSWLAKGMAQNVEDRSAVVVDAWSDEGPSADPDAHKPKKALTLKNLAAFIKTFEIAIAQTFATVIDATEGGARIAGALQWTLDEVIVAHCQTDAHVDRIRDAHCVEMGDRDVSVRRLIEAGESLVSDMMIRVENLKKGFKNSKKMIAMLEEKRLVNREKYFALEAIQTDIHALTFDDPEFLILIGQTLMITRIGLRHFEKALLKARAGITDAVRRRDTSGKRIEELERQLKNPRFGLKEEIKKEYEIFRVAETEVRQIPLLDTKRVKAMYAGGIEATTSLIFNIKALISKLESKN